MLEAVSDFSYLTHADICSSWLTKQTQTMIKDPTKAQANVHIGALACSSHEGQDTGSCLEIRRPPLEVDACRSSVAAQQAPILSPF